MTMKSWKQWLQYQLDEADGHCLLILAAISHDKSCAAGSWLLGSHQTSWIDTYTGGNHLFGCGITLGDMPCLCPGHGIFYGSTQPQAGESAPFQCHDKKARTDALACIPLTLESDHLLMGGACVTWSNIVCIILNNFCNLDTLLQLYSQRRQRMYKEYSHSEFSLALITQRAKCSACSACSAWM